VSTDDAILDAILAHEGGFSNHPFDSGRATNFGITQATLSEWIGRPASEHDVRNLTVGVARDIYRARYIRPFDAMNLPHPIKAQVVDIAVNSGVTTARAILSQAMKHPERELQVQLVIERLRHYARIVKGKPTQSAFILGWVNRACSFLPVKP
jgi:lysozyme family protein